MGACQNFSALLPTSTPQYRDLESSLAGFTKFPIENDLYPPILHMKGWQQPIPLDGPVTTAGLEDSPFITPDGQTLYYFFTPSIHVPPGEQVLDGVTGIYSSRLVEGEWEKPERVNLQDEGELSLDGCHFVSRDEIWFCSIREGNLREIDIWRAKFIDGRWQEWENAGEQLNLDYMVGELHLSADGKSLYYHTDALEGLGGKDLWVTRWEEGRWTEPENIAAVNSVVDEGWPFLSTDGKTLWFSRFYQGTPAIFRSQLVDGRWGDPELVISQFAGEPTLDNAGNLYFVHHFVVDGEIKDADIYVAYKTVD